MKTVAVVYHSGFGHTKVLADSVMQGLQEGEVKAVIYSTEDLSEDLSELESVDGIVFGAPTYMGSLSAPFKAFMDKSSKAWFQQKWKNKIAAGFTNSGSMSGDKSNSLVQLVTFACQHSMIWTSLGQKNESIPSGNPESVNRIGSYIGAMAQSDNEPPEKSPPSGDRETARLLGLRVASICRSFNELSS